MGRPLALDGRRLMGEYNNQPKVVVDGGWALEKRRNRGGACGGCCIFVLGGELKGSWP